MLISCSGVTWEVWALHGMHMQHRWLASWWMTVDGVLMEVCSSVLYADGSIPSRVRLTIEYFYCALLSYLGARLCDTKTDILYNMAFTMTEVSHMPGVCGAPGDMACTWCYYTIHIMCVIVLCTCMQCSRRHVWTRDVHLLWDFQTVPSSMWPSSFLSYAATVRRLLHTPFRDWWGKLHPA